MTRTETATALPRIVAAQDAVRPPPVINTEPLAYDTHEAARVLSIGRTTLFEEINAGRLEVRRVGGRLVITRDACTAWLNRLPVETRAAA